MPFTFMVYPQSFTCGHILWFILCPFSIKKVYILQINYYRLTLPKLELVIPFLLSLFGSLAIANQSVQFDLVLELVELRTRRVRLPSSRTPRKRPQGPEVSPTSGRLPLNTF